MDDFSGERSAETTETAAGRDRSVPVTVAADFGGPGRYIARPDVPDPRDVLASAPSWKDVALVVDRAGRVVAQLPNAHQREIVTRQGTWRVEVRRRWSRWELTASASSRGEASASATPALSPSSYRLQIGRRGNYVLSRGWLSGDWNLRIRRQRGTVISIERFGTNVWSLEVTGGVPQAHLPLLVPLIVVVIQADVSIPFVGGGG